MLTIPISCCIFHLPSGPTPAKSHIRSTPSIISHEISQTLKFGFTCRTQIKYEREARQGHLSWRKQREKQGIWTFNAASKQGADLREHKFTQQLAFRLFVTRLVLPGAQGGSNRETRNNQSSKWPRVFWYTYTRIYIYAYTNTYTRNNSLP